MHTKASVVFWLTLILYLITIATVSYVGVYLTYIAIPIIVVAGLVMTLTKPSTKAQKTLGNVSSTIIESSKAIDNGLSVVNGTIKNFNEKLQKYNSKNELIKKRTAELKEKIQQIKIKRIKPEIAYKYAKTTEEEKQQLDIISKYDREIDILEEKIYIIEQECEHEVYTKETS